MANDNCLLDIQCPNCGSLEPFRILGYAVFLVYDEGTSEFSDADWDDEASITCVACRHHGKVGDFRVKT